MGPDEDRSAHLQIRLKAPSVPGLSVEQISIQSRVKIMTVHSTEHVGLIH